MKKKKFRDDEEEDDEKEEENENNGMNEQVGSKIIQLLSLGKPDTSYKEDGQLRKNLPQYRRVWVNPTLTVKKREKFCIQRNTIQL